MQIIKKYIQTIHNLMQIWFTTYLTPLHSNGVISFIRMDQQSKSKTIFILVRRIFECCYSYVSVPPKPTENKNYPNFHWPNTYKLVPKKETALPTAKLQLLVEVWLIDLFNLFTTIDILTHMDHEDDARLCPQTTF